MSIDQETYDSCERLLRIALQTESTRADSSNLTAIPTPSSSSMVASTPFSVNERSSQASTPFLRNRSWSRVSSHTRNVMPNTPTPSSASSNRPTGPSSSLWLHDETNRYTDGAFRAGWEDEALLNQDLTRSQSQNTYIPPNQRLSEESSSGLPNITPTILNYENSAPMQDTAYMPAEPGWRNPPAQNQQLIMTPMSAISTGNQPQGQPDMVHRLERFLAHGQDLLRSVRQSVPIENPGTTSSQAPLRTAFMGPPSIHERSSAGQSLASSSPSPRVSGSRPISPTHDSAPSQQAQIQQQGHPNQPNLVQSGHMHRSQSHQRQHHRPVSSQPIPPTPYPAAENNIYATSANQSFSNISNDDPWPSQFPPGHQFGVPTSMAPDIISNNNDLTRLLESDYSIDDDATGMGFSSASNNNGMDPRFRG